MDTKLGLRVDVGVIRFVSHVFSVSTHDIYTTLFMVVFPLH